MAVPSGTGGSGTAEPQFAGLVERLEARLIGYLRFRMNSGAEAEDLFQEALMAAHRNWPELKRMDNPEAWVFRVARNLAINQGKRRGTERRVLGALSPGMEASPADRVAVSEAQQRISTALAGLPEPEREAVSLKIWAGLSWVEIGRLLDVSEDTAARLFARGLKALAPSLADLAPGGSA